MENGKYKELDRESVEAYHKRIDQLTREYEIAVQTKLLIEDRLRDCFRREGVNHFVNCRDLALQYAEIADDRFNGMLFPPDSKPRNRSRGLYNLDKN